MRGNISFFRKGSPQRRGKTIMHHEEMKGKTDGEEGCKANATMWFDQGFTSITSIISIISSLNVNQTLVALKMLSHLSMGDQIHEAPFHSKTAPPP